MTKQEVFFHWNYFRSLCERLNQTRNYVDHSTLTVNGGSVNNGAVFSNEFQQILILSSVEFENVGKLIALHNNPNFNMGSNIVAISKAVLGAYPRIIETDITSDYKSTWKPLGGWSVDNSVHGLPWWKDYNEIKHQGYENFHKATLNNAVESLAALNVLELYLMRIELGGIDMVTNYPCSYFSGYESDTLLVGYKNLPGF